MKITVDLNERIILKEFLMESNEHLGGIEDKILKLEVSKDPELINSIFRPIHTIKGSSSFLSLSEISQLSHEVETLLDDLRKGQIKEISSEIIDILLESIDTISKMLNNTQTALKKAENSQKDINDKEGATDESLEVNIEDTPYEEIMNKVIITRNKNKGAGDSTNSKASGQEISKAIKKEDSKTNEKDPPIIYSQIKYPGEMRLQYEVESNEQIGIIEKNLLILEKVPNNLGLYNELFRALHSLKGNTGVILSVVDNEKIRRQHFLNHLKEIAHHSESIVQRKRDNNLEFKENEIEILLNAADCMKIMLESFKKNQPLPMSFCPILQNLKDLSENIFKEILKNKSDIKEIGGDSLADAVSNNIQQGLDAIEKGIEEITVPEKRTGALKKLKRAYNNLLKVGNKINHNLLVSRSSNALNLIEFLMKSKDKSDNEEFLIQSLKDEFKELSDKADRRKNRDQQGRRKATLPPPTTDKEIETKIGEKVLKVSQDKIDVFMNLIGELLVSKNALHTFEREVSDKYDLPEMAKRLKETADNIARISNDLQNNIMEIRMLPIAHAFSKFPRMVRDLAKKLNKKIRLEVSGEDTEIDKNIIESLSDPLVHMVRNSADHGIEPPEERMAMKKPEEGTIQLSAFNQGQYVVIRIIDDGRGLDAEKIKAKAIERSLMPPEELEQMEDQQLYGLLFLPGFSMAGQISDVSGRGVGMDVVKTNIEKLGGEIQVESTLGKGSTFTIKLPLTMAIGRGLEVEASNNRYYVPLESITETLRISYDNIFQYKGKEMTVIRNELIPVYRLSHQLGLNNGNLLAQTSGKKKDALIILNIKNQKIGLLVDNYYNENEYVIKPLDGDLSNIEGISGAMITGEGNVHLILDPMRLF